MIAHQGSQNWQSVRIEHRPKFTRWTRKKKEMRDAISRWEIKAGRRPVIVCQDCCPFWHVGLPGSAIRHFDSASFKALAYLLENGSVKPQRTISQFRNDLSGDVVRRRTETAGHENSVASAGGF